METIKFKVTCKELNGGTTTTKVQLNQNFTFETTKTPGSVSVADINSGDAQLGEVITANGAGGATWESLEDIVYNLIELTSATGTLTDGELIQAQQDNCYIKLTLNDEKTYYRKYHETDTMIYFTYVSLSESGTESVQLSRQYIDITISSKAYSLEEGELIETYDRNQIDANFSEVDIDED